MERDAHALISQYALNTRDAPKRSCCARQLWPKGEHSYRHYPVSLAIDSADNGAGSTELGQIEPLAAPAELCCAAGPQAALFGPRYCRGHLLLFLYFIFFHFCPIGASYLAPIQQESFKSARIVPQCLPMYIYFVMYFSITLGRHSGCGLPPGHALAGAGGQGRRSADRLL